MRAVEHLLDLGHRRIACITNAPLAYTAAAGRLSGYRAALEKASIDFDPALVAAGGFDPASGGRAMNDILGRTRRVDAVFVGSDVVALGAIGSLRAHGLSIPGDVSIVGFDDIPLAAYFDPPLTTIRVPAHELVSRPAVLSSIGLRTYPSSSARSSPPTSSSAVRRVRANRRSPAEARALDPTMTTSQRNETAGACAPACERSGR